MRFRYDASHVADDRDPHQRLRELARTAAEAPGSGAGAEVGPAETGVRSGFGEQAPGGQTGAWPSEAMAQPGPADGRRLNRDADRSAENTDRDREGDEGGWIPDGAGRTRRSLGERIARSGPWGVLAEKWVPEPMRGARVDPSRYGAIALTAVAALSAVVAAVGVWWVRPQPVPLGATPVLATAVGDGDPSDAESGTAVSGDGSGAAGRAGAAGDGAVAVERGSGTNGESDPASAREVPSAPILVSVTGAVHRPGLVTVPADARVADAIAAAGGALDVDDMVGLNLAAKLADGDSIVVAGPVGSVIDAAQPDGAHQSSSGAQPASLLVNINGADLQGLQELPGVGPVTAQAIIAYRDEHGPFVAAEQLQEVPGIGPATMARLGPLITW